MFLVRFLRAMLGAGLGGAIWHFLGYFFEEFSLPFRSRDEIFISQLFKVIIYCMILSLVTSSVIALCRKFLQLELNSLARTALGSFLIASPFAILSFLLYTPYHSFKDYLLHSLVILLRFITIGGLAGLFYGNENSVAQDKIDGTHQEQERRNL